MATHFRVTLIRSPIGLPFKLRRVIRSLGIRHRMQTVYKPYTPGVVGALLKVKELVNVENVNEEDVGKGRVKAEKGFVVIGNALKEKNL